MLQHYPGTPPTAQEHRGRPWGQEERLEGGSNIPSQWSFDILLALLELVSQMCDGGEEWGPTCCLEAVGCWPPRQTDQMEVWPQQKQFPQHPQGLCWTQWFAAAAGALEGDRQEGEIK